jgi:signal peptidase II
MRTVVVIFAIVMNLALGDALVKEYAIRHLKGADPVTVIDGFFSLAYVENRGCAWGMLQGQVWPLAAFALAAFALIVWNRRAIFSAEGVAFKPRLCAFLARAAECLLYAGIFGNFIDRVMRGFVVDMFDFHWGESHFPCFNLADTYISLAAAILVVLGFLPRAPRPGAPLRNRAGFGKIHTQTQKEVGDISDSSRV